MPNTKITTSPRVAKSPSADVLKCVDDIAPGPLLPGEDEADYAKLSARFVAVAQPKDFIEELLGRDVIDLSWEILRLRRLKAGMLRAASSDGVRRILSMIAVRGLHSIRHNDFVAEWASGDTAKRKEFVKILDDAGLTMDDVMAEALSSKIDAFERLDRMLASAEARRNNALREIDRHREAFATAMRKAVDEIQDAEYRDVETGEVDGGPPT